MAGDKRRGYDRESLEFARVLTFSDGLFAIAMTLLVVGIEVPDIPDTRMSASCGTRSPTWTPASSASSSASS